MKCSPPPPPSLSVQPSPPSSEELVSRNQIPASLRPCFSWQGPHTDTHTELRLPTISTHHRYLFFFFFPFFCLSLHLCSHLHKFTRKRGLYLLFLPPEQTQFSHQRSVNVLTDKVVRHGSQWGERCEYC